MLGDADTLLVAFSDVKLGVLQFCFGTASPMDDDSDVDWSRRSAARAVPVSVAPVASADASSSAALVACISSPHGGRRRQACKADRRMSGGQRHGQIDLFGMGGLGLSR